MPVMWDVLQPAENRDEIELAIGLSNLQIVMERFKSEGWQLDKFLEACRKDGVMVIEVK